MKEFSPPSLHRLPFWEHSLWWLLLFPVEEKRPLKRMEAHVIPVHIKDKALCTAKNAAGKNHRGPGDGLVGRALAL